MQDLKDLKRFFYESTIAGDRPPRYGMQGRCCFTVGRGPVPRHASICTRNSLGRWTIFAQVGRSRGKPARMRVWHARAPALRYARPPLFHRRARACPSPCLDLHEKWPWAVDDVRAGRTIAGDRPRTTGQEEFSSPCAVREQVLPNYSHWDTRAISGETRSHARVACEGPRATGQEGFSARSVGPYC